MPPWKRPRLGWANKHDLSRAVVFTRVLFRGGPQTHYRHGLRRTSLWDFASAAVAYSFKYQLGRQRLSDFAGRIELLGCGRARVRVAPFDSVGLTIVVSSVQWIALLRSA